MGLTSAMFTGLSGLNANQFRIDTIGDNIANVNTTAFKSSRATFQNQFSIMLSAGAAPGATTGGTNPSQVGMGSALGSIQKNVVGGSVETTGVPTDMAIEGEGYFIVRTPDSDQMFTRDGMFGLDASNTLVTVDGYPVQGYAADNNFNINRAQLSDLSIPVGALTIARATTAASLDGNLNAGGDLATQGTILYSQALEEGPGAPATDTTLLTNLYDPATPADPLFADGDVITLGNVLKGGRQVPENTFTVTATSTLADFMAFLQDGIGINTDPALSTTPGIRLSDTDPPTPGTMIIEGNLGTENAIDIANTAIRSTNPNFTNPFQFTSQQEADGESVHTGFLAFDSLGTPVAVNMTMVLEDKTNSGTTWRFYAESQDDTDANKVLGTSGTVSFDNDGRMISASNDLLQIDRADTGAATPINVRLDFSNVTGLTTERSTLTFGLQDGFAAGTLSSFNVGEDGIVNGTFSNGLTRSLGQVALATFINPEGLETKANNLYGIGANSGQPMIAPPMTLGTGRIKGASLELSNVDLTREFIGLVTASTGFSAAGRVITTANDLLNQLLMIAR
jgi:flagellar hook protein FlgE